MQETTQARDRRLVGRPSSDESWRGRSDWATGRVRDETSASGGLLFCLWAFCIAWFGGLSLFMYAMRGAEAPAQLILGGFMVAGLLPLAAAIDQTRRYVRFRRSVFVMASVPGVIGGSLKGVIEMPMRLEAGARVRLRLTCWQRSDNPKFSPHVVWDASEETAVFPGPPGRVPVAFDIPFESPPSQLDQGRSSVFWVLSLEGTEKARGIHGRFEVPVYVTAASRSAQDGGPRPVTTKPFYSDVLVERPSPGVLNLRFQFGPIGWFLVVFLPLALPIALAAARQVRWAGEPLDLPWTGILIVTVLVVAFAVLTHFMEPMGVTVGGGQVTLLRGYRGWFPSSRVPLSDVISVNLMDCVNHLQQVVLQTRTSEDVPVSRVTTVMEARWMAHELRCAMAEGGGAIPEVSPQPLSMEGSPGNADRLRHARSRLKVAFYLVGVAVGLYAFGPSGVRWFAAQVAIERASSPPTRPPSLPEAAQPLAVYGDSSGLVTDWKWVVCEERETPRYACRLYGVQGGLEIVGDYWARAGTWGNRQAHQGRLPHPGETLEYSFLPNPATIPLAWPSGGELIARGVLFFPASGRKVTVVDEEGHLSEETPMSAQERANFSH